MGFVLQIENLSLEFLSHELAILANFRSSLSDCCFLDLFIRFQILLRLNKIVI